MARAGRAATKAVNRGKIFPSATRMAAIALAAMAPIDKARSVRLLVRPPKMHRQHVHRFQSLVLGSPGSMPFESSDAEIYFVVKYNGGAYYAPYSSWFVVERSPMGMFL